MAIVVTGGAGFIGSNLLRALADRGDDDLIVVDELDGSAKMANLDGVAVRELLDRDRFRELLRTGSPLLDDVTAVLHQGACSRTDEPDEAYLMDTNLTASLELLASCRSAGIPLIYASSAAVYGRAAAMAEDDGNEGPLNAYARSKHRFDEAVRASGPGTQVVGLRYFNVYGPREQHKGAMASLVTQLGQAVDDGRPAVLFDASHGCGPGGHRRDFVHVDDVVATICWFLDHPETSGIFNCGTGTSRSFQELAEAVIDVRGTGSIAYRPMPDALRATYQPDTCADLRRLRGAGCDVAFRSLERGIADTLGAPVARAS